MSDEQLAEIQERWEQHKKHRRIAAAALFSGHDDGWMLEDEGAALTALASDAIPALLAEVERLRAQRDKLLEVLDAVVNEPSTCPICGHERR